MKDKWAIADDVKRGRLNEILDAAFGEYPANEPLRSKLRESLSKEQLRAIRKSLGYTQIEWGLSLGVDAQTVHRWEKGKSEIPGPAMLLAQLIYLVPEVHNALC